MQIIIPVPENQPQTISVALSEFEIIFTGRGVNAGRGYKNQSF